MADELNRVYGTGLPRSGTFMLAKCLSIVRETHHECVPEGYSHQQVVEASVKFVMGKDIDLSPFIGHGSEVAFFYTFMATKFGGKVIYLWRPIQSWIPSALNDGLMKDDNAPYCPKDGWMGYTREEKLLSMWKAYQIYALESDSYITTADKINWRNLLDWLGWEYDDNHIEMMNTIQESKPNSFLDRHNTKRMYKPKRLKVPLEEAFEIESILKSRTMV